jgi:hypothetical protein
LLAHEVKLKPELASVHPRVFVTKQGLETLRARARTTHKDEWRRALAGLPALQGPPPPVPGPQERRSQNNVAFAIAGVALAYQVERERATCRPRSSGRLRRSTTSLGATRATSPTSISPRGTLLYAIGWAYDLLYDEWTPGERERIKTSLERHAGLVYDSFAPGPKKRFEYTQNHDFIPTAGLAVAALALSASRRTRRAGRRSRAPITIARGNC